jgi:phage shock protein PspC (stress-responsive transcriptional regulator)
MKEVINVSIGNQSFALDVDAYRRLSGYLADVRSRIAENADEVMADIEMRFADIFHEGLSSQRMVVSIAMVEAAIARMGAPEDFGPACGNAYETSARRSRREWRAIRRSRINRSVAGVCGGLAEFLGIDATILRLVTLFLILFGGMSLWIYIILWIVIPEE